MTLLFYSGQTPGALHRTFLIVDIDWLEVRRAFDEAVSGADVIGIMVGDLQRIRMYPAKDFRFTRRFPPTSGRRTRNWSKQVSTST